MDPISPSQQSVKQIFKDNPNTNLEQGMIKKKKKKKKSKKKSNSDLQVTAQLQPLLQLQNKMHENSHENSLHGSEGDKNQNQSLIFPGTNYSTQKSLSSQKSKGLFENEENDDFPPPRRERKTLFERSYTKESQQKGFDEGKQWRESTQGEGTLEILQVVVNQCNEKEEECGSTDPVIESNTFQTASSSSQKTLGQVEIDESFNPGGRSSGPSQENRQGGEMVENQRIPQLNQTVQNEGQIIPGNNGCIRLIQTRSLATINILTTASDRRWGSRGITYLKSLPIIPQVNRKIQGQFRIISFNVDTYFQDWDTRNVRKYYETIEEQRIKQIIFVMRMLMIEGVDLIMLQEVTSKTMRRGLLNLLIEFNSKNIDKYHYPETLKTVEEEVTTLTISKHYARFKTYEFDIQDPRRQDGTKIPLSKQSFCEIDMEINQKKQTVCFFNYHLISNGNKLNSDVLKSIRLQQIDAITRILNGYNRKFLIGDSNLGEGEKFNEQNKYLNERYFDAVNYNLSEVRGTYLYELRDKNEVIEERLDRIMVDKEHASSTSITIQYRDFQLKAAEGKGLDRKQMLIEYVNFYQFITLSDHTMLDATVTFYG